MALISEYGFNEGSGTMAADSSGNGYNIIVDSSKWTTSGYTGNAVQGPAVTASNVALGPSSLTSRTVMCWAKMPVSWPNSAMTVVAGITPNFEAMYIGGAVSGPNSIGRYDQANTIDVSGSTSMSLNTWYHLAWVTGPSGLKFYINAVLDGSNATTVSYGLAVAKIGTGDVGSTLNFTGIIDELRIFNTELSAAQITTWMNTPINNMIALMWTT